MRALIIASAGDGAWAENFVDDQAPADSNNEVFAEPAIRPRDPQARDATGHVEHGVADPAAREQLPDSMRVDRERVLPARVIGVDRQHATVATDGGRREANGDLLSAVRRDGPACPARCEGVSAPGGHGHPRDGEGSGARVPDRDRAFGTLPDQQLPKRQIPFERDDARLRGGGRWSSRAAAPIAPSARTDDQTH